LAKLAPAQLAKSTLTELPATHLTKPALSELATAKPAANASLPELASRPAQHVPRLDGNHSVGSPHSRRANNGTGRIGPVRVVIPGPCASSHSTSSPSKPTLAELATAEPATKPTLAELATAELPEPALTKLPAKT
jgi:hypothetical protein